MPGQSLRDWRRLEVKDALCSAWLYRYTAGRATPGYSSYNRLAYNRIARISPLIAPSERSALLSLGLGV